MLDRAAASDLHRKYVEILEMRVANAAGGEQAERDRARMRLLAKHFPGALRELDDLPMSEIVARVDQLDAVLRLGRPGAAWMEAIAAFHRLARGALAAKRWLAGRRHIDASVEQAYAEAVDSLEFPVDARIWQGDLRAIASPPGGKLTALVFVRIGKALGVTERAARELAFSTRRHAGG